MEVSPDPAPQLCCAVTEDGICGSPCCNGGQQVGDEPCPCCSGTPVGGDPGTGDPGTGDPGTGDPGAGEPGTGDPGTGDPGTGDPGTGDPGTGDPGTGDPGGGDGGGCLPGQHWDEALGTCVDDDGDEATTWFVHNVVGKTTNLTNGSIIGDDGRMTAPQNQTVAGFNPTTAAPVVVAVGESVPCAVEAASDADKTITTRDGAIVDTSYPADEVNYKWTAKDALGNAVDSFATAANPATTWTAPTVPGTYTLTCRMDDRPLPKPAGQGGKRDDAATLVASVTVHVVEVKFVEDEKNQKYGFDDFSTPLAPWKSVETRLADGTIKTDTAFAEITPNSDAAAKGVFFTGSAPDKIDMSPKQATAFKQLVTVEGITAGTSFFDARAGSATGRSVGMMNGVAYPWKARTVAIRLVHEENDDVQAKAVGATGNADTVCVSKGNNNFRDTVPHPDDALDANDNIVMGPDDDCDTKANNTNILTPDVIKTEDVINYLQKTYKQAVFGWKVIELTAKAVNFDLNRDGKLEVPLQAPWESSEMQVIINARDNPLDDERTHYIFLVSNQSRTDVGGINDYGRGYGFVFPYSYTSSAWGGLVVAHELGHGLNLYHKPNDAVNLMEGSVIATGPGETWRLRKSQWDTIQGQGNPSK